MPSIMCCGAQVHPCDAFVVFSKWYPRQLRCLMMRESPSEPDMYDLGRLAPIQTRLLEDLHAHRLIEQPKLSGFRDGGFLFDYAIRCLLPQAAVKREWNWAKTYSSSRAQTATHLLPLLSAALRVWLMGYIARNVVASLCSDFPRDRRGITKAPYPCKVNQGPRFFVSRYLLHAGIKERTLITSRLHQFLDEQGSRECNRCIPV